jgi:hypothetical protein
MSSLRERTRLGRPAHGLRRSRRARELVPGGHRALRRGRLGVGADALASGTEGGVADADAGGGMTEEEIREHVSVALALLPRDLPKFIAPSTPGQPGERLIEAGSALNDRCVVCDEIATQIRYRLADGAIAFHQRCHDIWKEEAMRPAVDGGATALNSP